MLHKLNKHITATFVTLRLLKRYFVTDIGPKKSVGPKKLVEQYFAGNCMVSAMRVEAINPEVPAICKDWYIWLCFEWFYLEARYEGNVMQNEIIPLWRRTLTAKAPRDSISSESHKMIDSQWNDGGTMYSFTTINPPPPPPPPPADGSAPVAAKSPVGLRHIYHSVYILDRNLNA